MNNYPLKTKLKDGTGVGIRPLAPADGPALLAFFRKLPKEDRLFLREDVSKEAVIKRWMSELDYNRVLPLVAEIGAEIVGDATLHFNPFGWARHVAEVRCVVARQHQRKGLGVALIRELVAHANQHGVEKILAQMTDTQTTALSAFQRLGFKREAELAGFVKDITGRKHNLVLMVNDVSDLWRKMEDLIIDSDSELSRG